MAKKLNSMPGYQARMPKQPHDVSQSYGYTCAPAQLIPTYYDMLHLGDDLHFQAKLFARLNPLNVASLGKIDVHMDYFFVPLSVMYTPAMSLFYQTDDLISSNFAKSNIITDRFPLYDIDKYFSVQDSYDPAATCVFEHYDDVGSETQTVEMPTNIWDCRGRAFHRILDAFDYNADVVLGYQDAGPIINHKNPVSTPWFLCAYQAAYQLYYRNDDREHKNYHYNLDRYYDDVNFFTAQDEKPLFALNYAQRPKDYFNSVKVSPIGSSVSMLNGSNSWDLLSNVNSYLFDVGSFSRFTPDGTVSTDEVDLRLTTVGKEVGVASVARYNFNAANIRQLFMVDKMLRVVGRADKNYESQFLAHYGIKIPHDVLHNITHIGHDMATMTPEPVISSANTYDSNTEQGSALGEIGGQGVIGFVGKKRNFTAPCHGVFLTIVHFMPRLRYAHGINKLHDLSSPMSFWQPEYDRKGMQPIFLYEVVAGQFRTDRYGWQFAYEQFKRKYDKVSSAFNGWYSRSTTVNNYTPWFMATSPYAFYRSDSQNLMYFNPSGSPLALLGAPTDINNIMQVPYDPRWIEGLTDLNIFELYYKDPFIVDFNMENKKVNFMSEYGEPEL